MEQLSPLARLRDNPPLVIAIALPLLLALTLAGVGLAARAGWVGAPEPATGPLAVVPVQSPQAGGPECAALLGALPGELPADGAHLPTRALAEPAPPGVHAWAALPRPVVLRCGLPRPVELTPTSALVQVNGVSWLPLTDQTDGPTTYVAVDRPVYVVVTFDASAGTGPLVTISDAITGTLPATPVRAR